jgi:hypothetical protein
LLPHAKRHPINAPRTPHALVDNIVDSAGNERAWDELHFLPRW